MRWSVIWFVFAASLAFSLHKEATNGYSVVGCSLRGLYGVNGDVCGGKDG